MTCPICNRDSRVVCLCGYCYLCIERLGHCECNRIAREKQQSQETKTKPIMSLKDGGVVEDKTPDTYKDYDKVKIKDEQERSFDSYCDPSQ